MTEDQAPQLTDEQIAEIQSSDLYGVVKYIFSDESNDPDTDYFVLLTQFFASLLQTAAMNSELIAKELISSVVAPLVGAPQKTAGGIVLPNGGQGARAGIEVQA